MVEFVTRFRRILDELNMFEAKELAEKICLSEEQGGLSEVETARFLSHSQWQYCNYANLTWGAIVSPVELSCFCKEGPFSRFMGADFWSIGFNEVGGLSSERIPIQLNVNNEWRNTDEHPNLQKYSYETEGIYKDSNNNVGKIFYIML